jgi:hypothetical protein
VSGLRWVATRARSENRQEEVDGFERAFGDVSVSVSEGLLDSSALDGRDLVMQRYSLGGF